MNMLGVCMSCMRGGVYEYFLTVTVSPFGDKFSQVIPKLVFVHVGGEHLFED